MNLVTCQSHLEAFYKTDSLGTVHVSPGLLRVLAQRDLCPFSQAAVSTVTVGMREGTRRVSHSGQDGRYSKIRLPAPPPGPGRASARTPCAPGGLVRVVSFGEHLVRSECGCFTHFFPRTF